MVNYDKIYPDEQWEKKRLFRYIGDYATQLYMIWQTKHFKDPYETTSI